MFDKIPEKIDYPSACIHISISVREVSRLIRTLDSKKATVLDKIPMVFLQNITPELSPIMANIFNRCLKERCFPSLCLCARSLLMQVRTNARRNITPLIFLGSAANSSNL